MHGKKKLAVAVSAMAIAAVGEGTAATAAQAQDEVLQATATTFTGGASGWCFKGYASATFAASGPATGPYPGSFTETNANVTVSRPTYAYASTTLKLSIPFAISSGGTTITGTVTNPSPYSGGSLLCYTGSMSDGGPIVNATAATYTASIQSNGQPAQTVGGTAQVTAAFELRPPYAVTPPTVTLLNFP